MTADRSEGSGRARKQLAGLGGNRLAQSGVFPLSSVKQELWLADQSQPGLPAYHITRVIEFNGRLNAQALDAALSEIVSRHEVLRTSLLACAAQYRLSCRRAAHRLRRRPGQCGGRGRRMGSRQSGSTGFLRR